MKELIGMCEQCGIEVYCEDGFFNGEQFQGNLYCPSCISE